MLSEKLLESALKEIKLNKCTQDLDSTDKVVNNNAYDVRNNTAFKMKGDGMSDVDSNDDSCAYEEMFLSMSTNVSNSQNITNDNLIIRKSDSDGYTLDANEMKLVKMLYLQQF